MTLGIRAATADGLCRLGLERHRELEDRDVTAYAEGQSGTWAATGGRDLWRRTADRWELVESLEDRVTCVLSSGRGVLLGTSGAHLLVHDENGTPRVSGFEAAEGRDAWYTPGVDLPRCALSRRRLRARCWRTCTSGASFDPRTAGSHGRRRSTCIPTFTRCAQPVARLSPRPPSGWRPARTTAGPGSSKTEVSATYARAVCRSGGFVLLSVSDGPRGGRAGIYRRPLAGDDRFERCTSGLPKWFEDNIDTGCLASLGSEVAFGTQDGRVFASSDEGATWAQVADDLPAVRSVHLADGS